MKARPIACVICGKETARESVSKHEVHLLGHAATYSTRQYACSSCGETFTNDDQGSANELAERRATSAALATITGRELKFLRDLVHITQAELETALGLGKNTIARWETSQREIPSYVKNLVRLVALNPASLLVLRDQDLPENERIGVHVLAGAFESAPHPKYESSRALPLFTVPLPSSPAPSVTPPSFMSASLGGGDDDFSLQGDFLRQSFPDEGLVEWAS